MRQDEVPQERSFYAGHVRVCYATAQGGHYVTATSRGFEAERVCTAQALDDLARQLEAVRQDVLAGRAAPLAFYMHLRQMTPHLLAASVGIWLLRVKRHLKPAGFAGLGAELRARYAAALDVPVEALDHVPNEPVRFYDEDNG